MARRPRRETASVGRCVHARSAAVHARSWEVVGRLRARGPYGLLVADPQARDPLADVTSLPGVFEALDAARGAVDALLRDLRGPALRRRGPQVGAVALRRASWASAVLETGGPVEVDRVTFGPPFGDDAAGRVCAGAWRVGGAVGSLVPTWERAPAQALARLHALAAADLVDASALGRPDPAVVGGTDRLNGLVDLVSTPTTAPALVLAAVVHGELAAVRPFGSMDGVVARAAARLVTTGRGLDPTGTAVVEAGHLELGATTYAEALAGYRGGTAAGVAAWVVHCAQATVLGARLGRALAAELVDDAGLVDG